VKLTLARLLSGVIGARMVKHALVRKVEEIRLSVGGFEEEMPKALRFQSAERRKRFWPGTPA